jgi:predicted transcriptional regulator
MSITSIQALKEAKANGVIFSLQRQIIRLLHPRGEFGITSSEAAWELYGVHWGLGLQSVTPRFAELARNGYIQKASYRRYDATTQRTRQVWILTKRGTEYAQYLIAQICDDNQQSGVESANSDD